MSDELKDIADSIRLEVCKCKWCEGRPENTHHLGFNRRTWMSIADALAAPPRPESSGMPEEPGIVRDLRDGVSLHDNPNLIATESDGT